MANTSTHPWFVNDARLDNLAYNIEMKDGWGNVSGRRGSNVVVPGRHGEIYVPNKRHDKGQRILSMWVSSKDPNGEDTQLDAYTQWRDNLDELLAIFDSSWGMLDVRHQVGPNPMQINRVANPEFAVDTQKWASNSANGAITRETGVNAAFPSGTWGLVTITTAPLSTSAVYALSPATPAFQGYNTGWFRYKPGDVVSHRITVHAHTVALRVRQVIQTYNVANSGVSLIPSPNGYVDIPAGTSVDLVSTYVIPQNYAGAVSMFPRLDVTRAAGAALQVGDAYRFGNATILFNQGTATQAISGSRAGMQWVGAANASDSILPGDTIQAFCDVSSVITPEFFGQLNARMKIVLDIPDVFFQDLFYTEYLSGALGASNTLPLRGLVGGTAPIEDLQFQVVGPITNPKVVDQRSGHSLQLNAAVAAGNTWEVNAATYSSVTGAATGWTGTGTNRTDVTVSKGLHKPRLFALAPDYLPTVLLTGTGTSAATRFNIRARRKYK